MVVVVCCGGGSFEGEPENVLFVPNLMLSYYLIANKNQDQHLRLPVIVKMKTDPEGVGLFFLDSGAFSMKGKATEYAKKNGGNRWAYYDTKEFWDYVDAYAAFVKEHQEGIDYYVNVDAIGNPELSWKSQRYLEKRHKLKPVPVVHCGSDVKWIEKYMAAGHDLIGLGGGLIDWKASWLDKVFAMVCNSPGNLPTVRLHGFAMTGYKNLIKYPWWSVDSATWTKVGANGNIMVPHKRGKEYTFGVRPYIVPVSNDSSAPSGKHYNSMSPRERKIIDEWLELIEVPFGKTDKDGTVIEYGVTNRHSERKIANLKFFEGLRNWLPAYPWPFKGVVRKGFGL